MADDVHPAPACLAFGERAADRLVDIGQRLRIERGQRPAERAVSRELHGVARATFGPLAEVSERFAVSHLPCHLRLMA